MSATVVEDVGGGVRTGDTSSSGGSVVDVSSSSSVIVSGSGAVVGSISPSVILPVILSSNSNDVFPGTGLSVRVSISGSIAGTVVGVVELLNTSPANPSWIALLLCGTALKMISGGGPGPSLRRQRRRESAVVVVCSKVERSKRRAWRWARCMYQPCLPSS